MHLLTARTFIGVDRFLNFRVISSLDFTTMAALNGSFQRKEAAFRSKIQAGSEFPVERGRYHLYVALACPWAHRTLILRALKGLESAFPVTVVDWFMGQKGWTFTDKKPKCTLEPNYGFSAARELYMLANPDYDGRITVPILWDKVKKTVVNNESSEIIRMFNSEVQDLCETEAGRALDLYPESLRPQINAVNEWIYPQLNNGVYRAGFATSQEAYEEAVIEVFNALDKIENILKSSRYLCGNQLTEADIRLFTTLVRFDQVYHGHFKCNRKRIIDYPNIWPYVRDIYQIPGVSDTVDMQHIRQHYMTSHESINPRRIVSIGPELDFNEPHGRQNMS